MSRENYARVWNMMGKLRIAINRVFYIGIRSWLHYYGVGGWCFTSKGAYRIYNPCNIGGDPGSRD